MPLSASALTSRSSPASWGDWGADQKSLAGPTLPRRALCRLGHPKGCWGCGLWPSAGVGVEAPPLLAALGGWHGERGHRWELRGPAAPGVMPARWRGAETFAPLLLCARVGEMGTTAPAYPWVPKNVAHVCWVKETRHQQFTHENLSCPRNAAGILYLKKKKRRFWSTNFLLKMQWGYTTSCPRDVHGNVSPPFHQLKNSLLCQALQRSQNAPLLLGDENGVKHERSSSSYKLQRCFFKGVAVIVPPRKVTKINVLGFCSELVGRLCCTGFVLSLQEARFPGPCGGQGLLAPTYNTLFLLRTPL